MNENVKKIGRKILTVNPMIYFFILSVCTFFLVEILNDSIWFFEAGPLQTRIFFMVLNIYIYYVFYLFIYVVTGNITVSSILGMSVFNIFALINYFVCTFRGQAFRFSDIFSAKTAANVVSMYKFKLAKAHIIWGILLVFTIVFCVQYLKKLKNRKIVNTMKSRIILSVIYLVIIIALFRFDYSVLGLNSFDGWNAGGYIIYFLDSANLQKIKKPECYEREKYKEISKVTVENIQKKTMPNIIVIMNESFCDIERITDIDTNKDVLPFFHEFVQRDNIIEGNVYVSVYAGNTANTEMEFLTASTLGFWGKENLCYSIGYSGHLDILPRWMNELGYTTYGIHPARGENYMRKDIYEKMEFKNKLFIEDFIEKNVKVIQYPNASYFLKNIVNDSDNYQFLTDIAKEKEEPIFIFNTTIQNHGGYQWRELADVKIQNENLDNDFQKDINEYLTLLNQSDAALKELISEIETWEEDTIVLFFGDHQPLITINLDQELDLDLSAKDFYNVPFFIWANYEIETKHNVNTSANYLQNILLEASGIGLLNEYQEYVSDVQKEYPILTPIYTEDKNGNQVDFDELLQQENNLIKEYYSQSYKIIYDADN